jgi:hypothetical protein
MAQTGHTTKLFGVNDAAVYKLTADASGSAPTYGTKVDVPGIKAVDAKLNMDTKTLRGDNTLLAADSVLKDISGSIKYAKHSFDVWTAMTSALTTDSGTTPATASTLSIGQGTLPAFFKLEAQSKQVDYVGGDVHILLYKCMPGTLPLGFNEEDYMEQSVDFTAVPLLGTITSSVAQTWMTILANETTIAIT